MADFDFGDWFDVDANADYHRLSMPNNVFAKDLGLYSFSSGELFEILKRERSICVKGDEFALKDPNLYTTKFAEETVYKILHNQKFAPFAPDASNVKLDHWNNTFITKKLTIYENEIHGGSGLAGAIQSHSELVLLSPSGALPNNAAYQTQLLNRRVFASEVARSPSGLYANIELSYRFGSSGVDGAECIKSQNTLVTCMLYGFDYLSNSRRNIAIKGEGTDGPMIAAAPSTVYGKPGTPKLDVPGTFENIAHGGLDNPKNTVAAPLDMHFEQNTGKFEAGTKQMVSLLVSDLLGCNSAGIDPDQFHKLKMDDFINSTSQTYMGNFELAEAMPVGVKGSNPNVYGPDTTGGPCEEGLIKETVVVVNRSTQSYSKGEKVLLGWISGEWLVLQSLDPDVDAAGAFQNDGWSDIFNMIGLATHMHSHAGDPDHEITSQNDSQLMHHKDTDKRVWDIGRDPAVQEEAFNEQFYRGIFNGGQAGNADLYAFGNAELFQLNKFSIGLNYDPQGDVEYDPGYTYQYTQFDMLHPQLGGANSMGNIIANCHHYETTLGRKNDPGVLATFNSMAANPFAGMSFPEGYEGDKLRGLKFFADKGRLQASGAGSYAHNYFGGNKISNVYLPWDVNQIFDTGRTPETGGAGVNRHVNAIFESRDNTHIPAEVALNGSVVSDEACPIQSLALLKWATDYPIQNSPNIFRNGRNRDNFAKNVTEYRKHRYHWLEYYADGEHAGDLWNLKPRNPNHVTFIPMMAEVATHLDSPNGLHSQNANNGKGVMDREVYRNLGGNAKAVPNHPVLFGFQAEQNSTNNLPISDGSAGSAKLNMFGDFFYSREIIGSAFGSNALGNIFGRPSFEMPNNSFEYIAHTAQGKKSTIKTYPYNTAQFSTFGSSAQPEQDRGPGYYFQRSLINFNWQLNGTNDNDKANKDFGSYINHISTAKVRISTNASAIEFSVDQLLGVNFETSITDPTTPRSQWGARSDDIGTYNTSALHARIVDAWPTHLTVFDPRCMAVHHFQPGDPTLTPRAVWYRGGRPLFNRGELFEDRFDPETGQDLLPSNAVFGYSTVEDGLDLYYRVEERSGSVDFRVPTLYQPGGSKGIIALVNTLVDSDDPMRKKQDWRVNTVKRGMVKPFHHYKTTIGFSKNDLQIISGGERYGVGDVLKGAGGQGRDAWLKVKSVGQNGEITAVEPFEIAYGEFDDNGLPLDIRTLQDSIGYGFGHEDFTAYAEVCSLSFFTTEPACLAAGGTWGVDPTLPGSQLRFSNYTGGDVRVDGMPTLGIPEGTGADIGVKKGIVYQKFIYDIGQKKRQVELLSLPSKEGKNTQDGNRGIAIGQRQKVVNIEEPLGIYDIYFYFHADVSYYTFNEDSQTPNWLNYCDLSFSPADAAVPETNRGGELKSLLSGKYGTIGKILGNVGAIIKSALMESDDEEGEDPPEE